MSTHAEDGFEDRSKIHMEVKNWIAWGFIILLAIAAVIVMATSGNDGMRILLPSYGIVFGIVMILDAIFYWQLFVTVRETSKTEYRISVGIIGALFIVLGILTLAGVI